MLVKSFANLELDWLPEEETGTTKLVADTLRMARAKSVLEALTYGSKALGFDSFVFGIVANDRRPDAESRTFLVTNQSDEWIRTYDDRSFLEFDPRIERAQEPGFSYWTAKDFARNARHKLFLTAAATYGIRAGLVVGLCTRDPPSYAMMALNRATPNLDSWASEHRMLIAAQASALAKVVSRSARQHLNEQELLFPAPAMRLEPLERDILTLCAGGMTAKEIAKVLNMSKMRVDIHGGAILHKLGALTRPQAIAKAIANNLINVMDDIMAEHKSAKIHALRGTVRPKPSR